MSSRVSGVLTAIMPHPMSTPTAAGMMEPLVASTVPTVAPLPKWQSGMTATCLKMNGIEAVFSICFSACSSIVSGGTNKTAFPETRYIASAYTGFTPMGYREKEERMLLIREIFFCKPGQVRPMVEKFKAINAMSERLGMGKSRIMTDLSAERYWTVVSEWEVKSLGEFERVMSDPDVNKEFGQIMKDYHTFVESGRREIYTIEA